MRAILLTLVFLILFLLGHENSVNAQTFNWAKSISSTAPDDVFDVATDASGNTYVAAYVGGTTTIGNTILNGGPQAAIAKFDPSGICLWAHGMPGSVGSEVYGGHVATDSQGNVYYGYSVRTWVLGLTSGYIYQFRLNKYSPSGTLIWAQQPDLPPSSIFDGYRKAAMQDLYIDETDSPVIVVHGGGNLTFQGQGFTLYGPYWWVGTLFSSNATGLIRFSPSGRFLWGREINSYPGPWAQSYPRKLSRGQPGQFWISGPVTSDISFQGGPTLTITGGSYPNKSSFIARYDTTGAYQWATIIGQGGHFEVLSIADAGNGTLALSGRLRGNVNIGSSIYTSIPNSNSFSQFVMRINESGSVLWINQSASVSTVSFTSQCVISDAAGNTTLATNFSGAVNVNTFNFNSIGGSDILLNRYITSTGNLLYSGTIGGAGEDLPRAMQVDASGNLIMAGSFTNSATLGGTALVSQGGTDGFVTGFTLPSAFSLMAGSPSSTGYCAGASFPVSFNALGLYQSGNQFALQLSDSSGSFANPVVVGTLTDTTSGTIQALLPLQVVPGTGYRLRVISNLPATISGDNGTGLTIWPLPHVNIATSGLPSICQGDSIVLSSSHSSGNLWSTGSISSQLLVSAAGQYSLTYTDPNGCTAHDSLSVIVNPLPQVSISASGPTTFCPGDSVIFSSNHPAGNLWNTGSTSAHLVVTATGNYTLTHTDTNGCMATASLSAIVKPMVPVSLSVPDSMALNAPALTFTGGLPSGGVYSGTGVSGSLFNPASAGLGTHIITYTFTDSVGCTGTATDSITVYMVNSASGLVAISGFRTYPNPAHEKLMVEWYATEGESVELVLTDVIGKVVYRDHKPARISNQLREIPLHNIAAGVYVLQLRSGQQSMQAKVVVQK